MMKDGQGICYYDTDVFKMKLNELKDEMIKSLPT